MQDDNQISLKNGAQTTIFLPGKSTSGYEWIVKQEGDSCIRIERNAPRKKSLKPGESNPENFIITAIATGTATLHFSLTRSWEKNIKPINQTTYCVKVD